MRPRTFFAIFAMIMGFTMIFFLLLSISPVTALGETFYVDAAFGDDSRPLLEAQDPSTPWKTLTHASLSVPAGDANSPTVIQVAAGLYDTTHNGETFPITITEAYIQVIGAGPTETVVDGEGISNVLTLEADGITIQGLAFENSAGAGIKAFEGGFSIKENSFSSTDSGVDVLIDRVLAGNSAEIGDIVVVSNTFDITTTGIVMQVNIDGDHTAGNVVFGELDILSNTFNLKTGSYGIDIVDYSAQNLAGGVLEIGGVSISDNEFNNGNGGFEFSSFIQTITDTNIHVGDMQINNNVFQEQEFFAVYVDYYGFDNLYGTTAGEIGQFVMRDNTIISLNGSANAVVIDDMGDLSNMHNDASVAVGDVILEGNEIETLWDGISISVNDAASLYDDAAAAMGSFIIMSNSITSAVGIEVNYSDVAYGLANRSVVQLGDIVISGNEIHSVWDGIYLDYESVAADLDDETHFTSGEVVIKNNSIESGSLSIYAYYYNLGNMMGGSSRCVISETHILNNALDSGLFGIYYEFSEGNAYDVSDQAVFSAGDVIISDNTITATDGVHVYYSDSNGYLYGDAQAQLSAFIITGNMLDADANGINFSDDYSPPAQLQDNAVFRNGGITIDDNTIHGNGNGINLYNTNACNDCSGSSTFLMEPVTIINNLFDGLSNDAIYLEYGYLPGKSYEEAKTVVEPILIASNAFIDVDDGIDIWYDEGPGYYLEDTAVITRENIVIRYNVFTNISGDAIWVYYDYPGDYVYGDARVQIGDLIFDKNNIDGANYGIYFETDQACYKCFGNSESAIGETVITNNRLKGMRNDAIWVAHGQLGHNMQAGARLGVGETTIANNVVNSNGKTGIYIYGDKVPAGDLFVSLGDTLIVNNALVDNTGKGLEIDSEGAVRAIHNTISNPTTGSGTGVFAGSNTVYITNTILSNQATGVVADSGATVVLDAVLWHENGANTGGLGSVIINSEVSGSPEFEADGYHLTESSAAIDAGVNAGIDWDIDGDVRPDQVLFDIGADEFLTEVWSNIYLPLVIRGN